MPSSSRLHFLFPNACMCSICGLHWLVYLLAIFSSSAPPLAVGVKFRTCDSFVLVGHSLTHSFYSLAIKVLCFIRVALVGRRVLTHLHVALQWVAGRLPPSAPVYSYYLLTLGAFFASRLFIAVPFSLSFTDRRANKMNIVINRRPIQYSSDQSSTRQRSPPQYSHVWVGFRQ